MDDLASAHAYADGILFIEDFDAPPEPPQPAQADIVTPAFTHDDLEAARAEGFQAGQAEARADHEAVQAQLRNAALTAIGEALDASRADASAVARQIAEELAATLVALLAAALPACAAKCAETEINALLAVLLPPMAREPDLRVRVHPSALSATAAALETHWPDHAARLTLTGDAALGPSDAVVSWENGEARRDMAAFWAELRDALGVFGLPPLAEIMKECADAG
jgi:flagellar biosynthesis/type III secretory pathway protein FliH